MKKFLSYLIFYIIQFTWGIVTNIIGMIVAIAMLITLHKPHRFGPSIYFELKCMENSGFELGIFFLIGTNTSNHVKYHEAGHGIQNMFLGPLFPFLVAIPSFIRYWYREFKYYKKGLYPKTKYDDIWFEGQATRLGHKHYYGLNVKR